MGIPSWIPNLGWKSKLNTDIPIYTPQIMFLLAFSFANFENWGVTFLGSVVSFYRISLPSIPSGGFKICKCKSEEKHFWGVHFNVREHPFFHTVFQIWTMFSLLLTHSPTLNQNDNKEKKFCSKSERPLSWDPSIHPNQNMIDAPLLCLFISEIDFTLIAQLHNYYITQC